MKLEDQVCSLDQAKKLKELGIKQESLFLWVKRHGCSIEYLAYINAIEISDFEYFYSAFTVAELGKMLPRSIIFECKFYFLNNDFYLDGTSSIYYSNDFYTPFDVTGSDNEAYARSKMLICLLENKIIDLSGGLK